MTIDPISSGITYTISMWVYPNSPSAEGCLFTNYAGVGLSLMSTRKVNFYLTHGHESTAALTNTAWNHIVLSVTDGVGMLYINGTYDSTIDHVITNANYWYIGDRSTEEFKGNLDAIGIWVGRGLTAAEVTSVMAATYPF